VLLTENEMFLRLEKAVERAMDLQRQVTENDKKWRTLFVMVAGSDGREAREGAAGI
jgi:hypothetical protein